jgi:hypothetical protein
LDDNIQSLQTEEANAKKVFEQALNILADEWERNASLWTREIALSSLNNPIDVKNIMDLHYKKAL